MQTKEKRRARRVALALTVALLLALMSPPLSGHAEALDEIELVEDAGGIEELPGEVGEILLTDADDTVIDADMTPAPEVTVAPTPKTEPQIPWLTSVNYPKGKINFEGEIWSIMTGRWGLTDYQAAGLMSSIEAESAFCPYNVQGRGGSDDRGAYLYSTGDSVGFGLCQWTSSGRKAALLRHAARHGSADLVWDFDIQMGYMGSEIDMGALKSTGNLYEATEWAALWYERPSQAYANSWPGTRYERGKEIYKRHTGREYDEPELRFYVGCGDASDGAPAAEAEGDAELTLKYGAPASVTVRCNYYWRLAQTDATMDGWLDVRCPSLYRPEQWEDCVCGYVCDGRKPLTLTALKLPPLGQTYRTTLRFEAFRGEHVYKTVSVAVTCTPWDALSTLRRLKPVLTGQALAVACAAVGMGKERQ